MFLRIIPNARNREAPTFYRAGVRGLPYIKFRSALTPGSTVINQASDFLISVSGLFKILDLFSGLARIKVNQHLHKRSLQPLFQFVLATVVSFLIAHQLIIAVESPRLLFPVQFRIIPLPECF